MNPAHHLGDGGRAAHLKTNVQTEPPFGALADLERVLCLRYIYAERLFAIRVLATVHYGLKVLHVKPRRR